MAVVVHGGGWPGSFRDVASAADFLRTIAAREQLDLNRVISIGHSAGGDYALWLAARHRIATNSELHPANRLPTCGRLTEHLGSEALGAAGEDLADGDIHDRDLEWRRRADVLVRHLSGKP